MCIEKIYLTRKNMAFPWLHKILRLLCLTVFKICFHKNWFLRFAKFNLICAIFRKSINKKRAHILFSIALIGNFYLNICFSVLIPRVFINFILFDFLFSFLGCFLLSCPIVILMAYHTNDVKIRRF